MNERNLKDAREQIICHNIHSNDDAYFMKLLRLNNSIAFMFKIYDYILINFR